MIPVPAIVCFSHLRWNSVFQRPHHLLTRLARHYPIYFFEEPIATDTDMPYLTITDVAPNIRVCQPHLRTDWGFFAADAAAQYERLLGDLLRRERLTDYIFWFYTPQALHFARDFAPRAIVYDCMDELSHFKFAPAELLDLEAELLRRADVVFTGGPSLYAAKRHRHHNIHLFPSSVDTAHFQRATDDGLPVHPATAAVPAPRLGFYGVIDERIDLALLDGVAAARPDWQFIIVGPVAKIDPADLPQQPNLHYPGPADYRDLPAHLAGWQVALMPFARNEATRFISPTKTLEYMAAGKPIISTSIADVVQPYGHIIAIADSIPDFVAACERALNETEAQRRARLTAYARVLDHTSWDKTVSRMRELLQAAVQPTLALPASLSVDAEAATSAS